MNQLLVIANDFINKVNVQWAICGGFALDLFLEKEIRTHSDIDICVFEKDREKIFQYMLQKAWNVYEFRGQGKLRPLNAASISERGRNLMCINGSCDFVRLFPCEEENFLYHEFIHSGIKEFNYLEFLFNEAEDKYFMFDGKKGVARELEKAILYNSGIPFLAPEIVLLYKSSRSDNPEYQYDFEQTYEHMNAEQQNWFSHNLEILYPNGHKWKV